MVNPLVTEAFRVALYLLSSSNQLKSATGLGCTLLAPLYGPRGRQDVLQVEVVRLVLRQTVQYLLHVDAAVAGNGGPGGENGLEAGGAGEAGSVAEMQEF